MRRWALIVTTLLVVAAGTAWWLASRDATFEWLVAEAVRRSGGALAVEGVRGSLFGPFAARRVSYAAGSLRIVLEDVTIDAIPREMARRRLVVRSLEARSLELEVTPSGEAARAPDSLAIPFPVSVARATIQEADLQGYKVRGVAFAYEGGADSQSVSALKAESEDGSAVIDLRIGAHAPFELSGTVALVGRGVAEGWTGRAKLSGSLAQAVVIDAGAAARGAQASGTARVAAFERRWLQGFQVTIENLDPALFAPKLPHAQLVVDVSGAGTSEGLPAGQLSIANERPGLFAAGRIPLVSMRAAYRLGERRVDLTQLHASLGGGGSISGTASLQGKGGSADLNVSALDLRRLHASLRQTSMSGSVRAEFSGAEQRVRAKVSEKGIGFVLDATKRGDKVSIADLQAIAGAGELRGKGEVTLVGPQRFSAQASLARVDASKFGDYPKSLLNGEMKLEGALLPEWHAGVLLTVNESVVRGVRFKGSAEGAVSPRGARNLKVALIAGTNALNASGNFGRPEDVLEFTVDAKRLAELDPRVDGALQARGRLSGTRELPGIDVDIASPALAVKDGRRFEAVRARVTGTSARHVLTVEAKSQPFDFAGRIEGRWAAPEWTGSVVTLENKGTYPATLVQPVPVRFGGGQLTAGPAEARIAGGRVSLQALAWSKDRLDTRGEVAGMPIAPFVALAGVTGVATDLRVKGRWDLATTTRLNGTLALAREAGDVVLTGGAPIPLHLERLSVEARVVNDAVQGTLEVAGGTVNGRVSMTASALARDAALKADGNFEAETLKLLAPVIGTRAIVDGRATLALSVSGTVGAPRLTGNLKATGFRVEAPQYGVRLRDGALHAELTESALKLSEFTIHGGSGRLTATGVMSRGTKAGTTVEWRAEGLQVFDRPDMRLKVDGKGTVGITDRVVLRGTLAARQAYFEFEKESAPKLSNDVVVLGRPAVTAPSSSRPRFEAKLLDVDVDLDFGAATRIVGAGLDTMLSGKLRVRSSRQGLIETHGTLVSSRGVYYAFGQRLDIERGRLIFDGAPDNPALDIVAKRKNLQVEAGVELTGTVQVPRVQLVSTPAVPDSEKLAWLTLGRPLREVTATDAALLQAAASALNSGGKSVPLTRQIAGRLGLDDIAVRGGGAPGTQVVAVGKRFSDKLYVEYQQGMAATSAMLRLSYVLTKAISLRLEAGSPSTVGVNFSKSFE